jgi:hypothetical protein
MASLISPPCHSFETSSKLASGVCLRRNNSTAQLLRDLWNRVVPARGHCVHQPLRAFMPQEQPINLFSVWFESIRPTIRFTPFLLFFHPANAQFRTIRTLETFPHESFGRGARPFWVCLQWLKLGTLQANKKHSFHNWRRRNAERRCQSPERSLRARKRARRGFGVCAAQSCTSGIDRRSRPERQTSP